MTFTIKLERADGTPAEPQHYRHQLAACDTIALGRRSRCGVVRLRDDDADQPPVLVVEDMPGSASGTAA
jgi:hypothetical protein